MGSLRKVALSIIVILVVFWSIFPIYWSVNMSLMYENEIFSVPPHWIPENPTLHNYGSILGLITEELTLISGQGDLIRLGLTNSLIIGSVSALIATILASIVGYVFGRYSFRFKGGFLMTLLMTRMLPPISIIIPYYMVFSAYGLLGTHLGLIITYVGALIPLVAWMLLGVFATLPVELERAARVDGYGRLRTFFKVAMRMAAPGIVSTAILAFGMCWNDFAFAQILAAGSPAQTLQPSIAGLFTQMVLYSMMSAAVTFSLIPAIVLTLIFGKYITQLKGVGSMTLREAM